MHSPPDANLHDATADHADHADHADGAVARAVSTLGRLVHPDITITDPPEDATVDWDVAVPMRDGVRLRVNVFDG